MNQGFIESRFSASPIHLLDNALMKHSVSVNIGQEQSAPDE